MDHELQFADDKMTKISDFCQFRLGRLCYEWGYVDSVLVSLFDRLVFLTHGCLHTSAYLKQISVTTHMAFPCPQTAHRFVGLN